MTDRKLALLSVHDKAGLTELGRGLTEYGFSLVASGGTARALADAGLEVTPVEQLTGFAEILDGRVKTLHPAIHGGILSRRTAAHRAELEAGGIHHIDLVVCNLYPFVQTAATPDITERQVVEQIDIGGVTLLRAAAKNYESVAVVCDPADYQELLAQLAEGPLTLPLRQRLALQAFSHTAAYDGAICGWLARQVQGADERLPPVISLVAQRELHLRYGENPHQQGALYRRVGQPAILTKLRGKKLSFNNIVDLDAAWAMPKEFDQPTVAIIKHTNPCGLASADTLLEAYELALECDPVSAFGSIIATNRPVDLPLVEAIGKLFVEVLVAPSYSPEALAWLGKRKKKCRVVTMGGADPLHVVRVGRSGLLVQTADDQGVDISSWKVATKRQPTEAERRSLAFGWLVVKHVKSNAIVFTRGTATVGVGAGQMNRVDSVFLAARRAGDRARGAVMASDAFFPFPDGVETAAEAGITACIQPGGSIRDEQVIEAADKLDMAMVLTGQRHFRH